MSLFAHALRRTLGAFVVLLVAIWLIQFGVSHFDAPREKDLPRGVPGPIRESIEESRFPISGFQPGLANEWNAAAGVVGVALLALLALGLAWRLRGQRAA